MATIRGFSADILESPLDLSPRQSLQARYERVDADTMDLHFVLRIVHDRSQPG